MARGLHLRTIPYCGIAKTAGDSASRRGGTRGTVGGKTKIFTSETRRAL